MPHSSLWPARGRLASLWLSQAAHMAANYGLRVFVVLEAGASGAMQSEAAWHLVTALFMFPAIFLVPVYGALGNSLPKRASLLAAALWCLAVTTLFVWNPALWQPRGMLLCVALVALGSALYTPTRFALLPAAAQESRLPLGSVVAWIETAAVLSIVGGMILGGALSGVAWDDFGIAPPAVALAPAPGPGVLWLLTLLVFALALPVRFPSDVHRPEPPLTAFRGFFLDVGRLLTAPRTGASLAAIALLRGIVTVAAGAFIARAIAGGAGGVAALVSIAVFSMAGAGVGAFLAGLAGRHRLALAALGAAGLVAILGWLCLDANVPLWLCILVGGCGGLINVPLLALYQESAPEDCRGNANALLNTAGYLSMTVLSAIVAGLSAAGWLSIAGQFRLVAAVACASVIVAGCSLRRAIATPQPVGSQP
ncbi:MAG: MFS transporter [Gemmataceae bacterium]|nr:MFS transporter [Gemmataceae bacterium]